MKYLDLIRDIFYISTINLPLGQLHGLIFILLPLNLWYKQNNSFDFIMILKFIIAWISCFNYELLNVVSGINNKSNDIREKNMIINEDYENTFNNALSIQIFLGIIINLYERNHIIFILIFINSYTTWQYTIMKASSNATYKAVYTAYIAITLHPFVMIDYLNYNKNIITFHIFAYSLIWLFFDLTQDVKDIQVDYIENRMTAIMILFETFGEKISILILVVILNIIGLYINIIFETNLFPLFGIGSFLFLLTSLLNLKNKKFYYKICWNFVSVVFIVWILLSPDFDIIDKYEFMNLTNSILFSIASIGFHYFICKKLNKY